MRTSLLEIFERALVGKEVRIRYYEASLDHIEYLKEMEVMYEDGWVRGVVKAVSIEEIDYEADCKVIVIGSFVIPLYSDTEIEIL
jgi:hypothetical protein